MNVVAMPMIPMQLGSVKSVSASNNSQPVSNLSKNSFGAVFGQLTLSKENTTTDQTAKPAIELGDLTSMMNATSLEELIGKLDIPVEEMELNGQLSIEEVANMLQLDVEELKKTIQQLLGDEKTGEDLWGMLNLIENQSPMFMKAIMESLTGEGKVTGKQAASVLQFLKAVELAAPKTDLVLKQEVQVFSLKEILSTISSNVEKMVSIVQPAKPFIKMPNSKPGVVGKVSETPTTSVGNKTTDAGVQQVASKTVKTTDAKVQQVSKIVETSVENKTTEQVVLKTTQTQENQQVSSGTVVTQVKTETVTLTLPTQKQAQPEALVKEFQSLLNRSQFGQAGGTTKMLIKMYPEQLGTIRVELIQKDGVMTARLLANTALGKEMLDSQLHQLKSAFANANVQVDRVDVTQALQDTNKNDKQQQFSQSFKQQQNQEAHEHEQEETPEQASFREFLMELEA
jgi:flagellar hook-length control protein FliK